MEVVSSVIFVFAVLVDEDAVPLNVVAVIVFPDMLILESTYTAVPPKPVEDLLPNKYKVDEVSVVVAITWAEVAVPDNVPVIVPLFKVTPETEAKLEDDVHKEPPIPTPPTTVKAPVDVEVDAVLYKTETAVPVICMESVAPEL